MANNVGKLVLRVTLTNTEALAAFGAAVQLIEEAAGDLEWREDLPEAVRLLRVAAAGFDFEKVQP